MKKQRQQHLWVIERAKPRYGYWDIWPKLFTNREVAREFKSRFKDMEDYIIVKYVRIKGE